MRDDFFERRVHRAHSASTRDVQIIATPRADPSKAASLEVSILPAIAISISPSTAAVPLGAAQAFQATVTGLKCSGHLGRRWHTRRQLDCRIYPEFAGGCGHRHVYRPTDIAVGRFGRGARGQHRQSRRLRRSHRHLHYCRERDLIAP